MRIIVRLCLLLILVTGCGDGSIEAEAREDSVAPTPTLTPMIMAENEQETAIIRLAIEHRIGWQPLLDANGGLQTAQDSLLGRMSIPMDIRYEDDISKMADDFIHGTIDAFGCSVARLAELYPTLAKAGKAPVMAFVVGKSKGADAVLARSGIDTFESLLAVGGTIAAYPNSGAYDMLAWHILHDDNLDAAQKAALQKAVIQYSSPAEAELAYRSGETDALCASDPIISQIAAETNAVTLLSSSINDTVLVGGIVFDRTFAESHRPMLMQFAAAVMRQVDDNAADYSGIEGFSFVGRQENFELFGIRLDSAGAYTRKRSLLEELYTAMGGTRVDKLERVAYPEILLELASAGRSPEQSLEQSPGRSSEPKEIQVLTWEEWQRLRTRSIASNSYEFFFKAVDESKEYVAEFTQDSSEGLEKIAESARNRGGADIVLVGHVANIGQADMPSGRSYSQIRAMAVARLLVDEYGIEAGRLTVVGAGMNESAPGAREHDRRVDVIFRVPE